MLGLGLTVALPLSVAWKLALLGGLSDQLEAEGRKWHRSGDGLDVQEHTLLCTLVIPSSDLGCGTLLVGLLIEKRSGGLWFLAVPTWELPGFRHLSTWLAALVQQGDAYCTYSFLLHPRAQQRSPCFSQVTHGCECIMPPCPLPSRDHASDHGPVQRENSGDRGFGTVDGRCSDPSGHSVTLSGHQPAQHRLPHTALETQWRTGPVFRPG